MRGAAVPRPNPPAILLDELESLMTCTFVSFISAVACGVAMLFGYELGDLFIGGMGMTVVLACVEA